MYIYLIYFNTNNFVDSGCGFDVHSIVSSAQTFQEIPQKEYFKEKVLIERRKGFSVCILDDSICKLKLPSGKRSRNTVAH